MTNATMFGAGHNSGETPEPANAASSRLRALIERIERLEEERKVLSGDIKDIYMEAKSAGFDPRVMRDLVRIRKQDADEVREREEMLDLYRRELGMP